MLHRIFTVYDAKAKAYLQPFFFPQTGQAVRAFTELVNDEKTQFYKHAEDYTLYVIGKYDDTKGDVKNETENINLGNGLEFVDDPRRRTLKDATISDEPQLLGGSESGDPEIKLQ